MALLSVLRILPWVILALALISLLTKSPSTDSL